MVGNRFLGILLIAVAALLALRAIGQDGLWSQSTANGGDENRLATRSAPNLAQNANQTSVSVTEIEEAALLNAGRSLQGRPQPSPPPSPSPSPSPRPTQTPIMGSW